MLWGRRVGKTRSEDQQTPDVTRLSEQLIKGATVILEWKFREVLQMAVVDFTAVRSRKLGDELAALIWYILAYRR